MNIKSFTIAALLASASVSAFADTAGNTDLIIGFKAANVTTNVEIDLGPVTNYTAVGVYNLGNVDSILSTTFTSSYNTITGTNAVAFGAVAAYTDLSGIVPDTIWFTGKWNSVAGTLGVKNSATPSSKSSSAIQSAQGQITAMYAPIGSYTVGTPFTISTSTSGSFSNKDGTALTGTGFNNITNTAFLNTLSNTAPSSNYVASDLYTITDNGAGYSFVQTLVIYTSDGNGYRKGDVTFAVIPEPTTCAAILGAAVFGFAMRRRRFSIRLV